MPESSIEKSIQKVHDASLESIFIYGFPGAENNLIMRPEGVNYPGFCTIDLSSEDPTERLTHFEAASVDLHREVSSHLEQLLPVARKLIVHDSELTVIGSAEFEHEFDRTAQLVAQYALGFSLHDRKFETSTSDSTPNPK